MNFGRSLTAFELVGLYFMAKESGTVVTFRNGTVYNLDQGRGTMVRVTQGDTIVSNKPIQVDLVTGDLSSAFALRWFSLRPAELLSNSYVSPVGENTGKTKLLLYNPHPRNTVTFTLQYLRNNTVMRYSQNLLPKQSALSVVIPDGSGAWVNGTGNFVALSYTDTEIYDGIGRKTNGWVFDWGFPLVPRNELTSQVLVGFGYACKNNQCQGTFTTSISSLGSKTSRMLQKLIYCTCLSNRSGRSQCRLVEVRMCRRRQ
jgi:hypothetical protein